MFNHSKFRRFLALVLFLSLLLGVAVQVFGEQYESPQNIYTHELRFKIIEVDLLNQKAKLRLASIDGFPYDGSEQIWFLLVSPEEGVRLSKQEGKYFGINCTSDMQFFFMGRCDEENYTLHDNP